MLRNKPPPDRAILQIRQYEDKLQDMKSKCTEQVLDTSLLLWSNSARVSIVLPAQL